MKSLSREIKFRARRCFGEKVGEWEYVEIGYDVIRIGFVEGYPYFNNTCVDGSTIGQYTGLHDKNGKEIYEGDIISRENTCENNCVVKWDDESCGFTLNYIYFDESYNMNEFWDDFEIIGNIYENPELKEENK